MQELVNIDIDNSIGNEFISSNMINEKRCCIALVPIRHHSQRVSGKNYRLLGDYPLYYHVLNSLKSCRNGVFDAIVVNTDSDLIISGIKQYFGDSIIILKRDEGLCGDDISMNIIIDSSLIQLAEMFNGCYEKCCVSGEENNTKLCINNNTVVFQTHVTSPFLSKEAIELGMGSFLKNRPDTLFSVTKYHQRFWTDDGMAVNHSPEDNLMQTQDLTPFFGENSAFYIFSAGMFNMKKNRIGENIGLVVLDNIESLDIDTEKDFELCEMVYQCRQRKGGMGSNVMGGERCNKVLNDDDILSRLIDLYKNEFILKNAENGRVFNNRTVLISAPYMMPNIGAFEAFFNCIGMEVIVADVKERLNRSELSKYVGRYDIAIIGDDEYTLDAIREAVIIADKMEGDVEDTVSEGDCSSMRIEKNRNESLNGLNSLIIRFKNFIENFSGSTGLSSSNKMTSTGLNNHTAELGDFKEIDIDNVGNVDNSVSNTKYVSNFVPLPLNNHKKLVGLCKWGTGIDSISKEGCKLYNVELTNTPNAFTEPVAESIMSAILAFSRGIYNSTNMMCYSDKWVKIPCRSLSEMTIGIIGYGNIGRRLGEMLRVFNARVVAYDIVDKKDCAGVGVNIVGSIEEVLLLSDIVCLCCDYREGNRHLMKFDRMKMMKRGSYLINMARGQLINNDELVSILQLGHLNGVALDVFEVEPLPSSHPLRKMNNVLLSSHNANSSPKAWLNVHVNTVRNCLRVLVEKSSAKSGSKKE